MLGKNYHRSWSAPQLGPTSRISIANHRCSHPHARVCASAAAIRASGTVRPAHCGVLGETAGRCCGVHGRLAGPGPSLLACSCSIRSFKPVSIHDGEYTNRCLYTTVHIHAGAYSQHCIYTTVYIHAGVCKSCRNGASGTPWVRTQRRSLQRSKAQARAWAGVRIGRRGVVRHLGSSWWARV